MKKSILFLLFCGAVTVSGYSQNLVPTEIGEHSLVFEFENGMEVEALKYWENDQPTHTQTINGNTLLGLTDASLYYVQAQDKQGMLLGDPQLFITGSKSSGDIRVYFNQFVNNNVSSITDAIHTSHFEDTIVAFIDGSQTTLDVCNYNSGSLAIITAINNAETRGVTVRYVGAHTGATNNNELNSLSGTIPQILRPNDGEVMHNKFIIRDVNSASTAQLLGGSTNHTNNSLNNDYNNLVIIEDQSLALAYKIEFEEMWGSSTNTPNATNAKFGADKVDNTPHNFTIGGTPVELYFSPSDNTTSHIETAVLSANSTVEFALLTYTNNDLGDAVINRQNAGITCRGIIENTFYFGSEYNGLLNAGVDVQSHSTTANVFHHKYCIVDALNSNSDPLVITGSHNWSNSAEDDYDENTLIIHNEIIANMYLEEFDARFNGPWNSIAENSSTIDVFVFENDLRINSDKSLLGAKIEVLDLTGKVVIATQGKGSSQLMISLEGLSSGLYLVQINDGTRLTSKKFFK